MTHGSFFYDSAELQTNYEQLVKDKKLTKKAICELCVPFKDKYGLTASQALMIARKEMPLKDMVELDRRNRQC